MSLRYSASILGREVFSGEMIPRVLTHRLGVILKLQGVATIAPCNVRRVDIRTLITARPLWGPGADEKYKSQEEKAKEQQNKDKQKKIKIFGSVIAAGTVLGGLFEYQKYKSSKKVDPIGNEDGLKQFLLKDPPPKFEPARVIPATSSSQNMKITLFQYQTCPFCCKARAFLDYFGLSYDVVEVNSVMRTQVKWSKYKKVPIVVVEVGDKVSQSEVNFVLKYYHHHLLR